MTKKLSCLLLAIIMILQLGVTVFADDHFDNVDTAGNLQIIQSGNTITDSTGNSVSVSKYDSEAFPKFDYLCTLDMQNVRDKFTKYYNDLEELSGYLNADKSELTQKLDAMKVTGKFTIEITYPKTLNVPAEFFENGKMAGFDDNVKLVFGNDVRTLTEGETENTLKIEVDLVGKEDNGSRPGFVYAKELNADINKYLCDFTLRCDAVETTEYGTFTVTGKMAGFTKAIGRSTTLKVDYKTDPESASCTVSKRTSGGGNGGTTTYTVTFDVDGDTNVVAPIRKTRNSTLKVNELKVPHKDGYSFDGWYTDEARTEKVTKDITVTKNMTLYGTWKRSRSAGRLNDVDHFAYVVGYPDGTVRPDNSITREEIATIFFRLLLDEERNGIFSKTNGFTDVDTERWSNTAISTMENGGFIKGYEDGNFGPDKNITRAEFATIASRLDKMTENTSHGFTDISGHWAEKYIADAVAKGWIAGYEDGTFRPEQNITRAEAMTIINRMLNRFVNEKGLHKDAILWPDNNKDAWYYYAVEEATNSHDYVRQSDGVYETWTAMRPNKDWSELEK